MSAVATTPGKSPRKQPHCSICKQPRKGHPRSGCPFGSPNRVKSEQKEEPDLENAFKKLNLTPNGDVTAVANDSADRRRRRSSVKPVITAQQAPSLSTTALAVVDDLNLKRRGIFDDAIPEEEKAVQIQRWQKTLRSPRRVSTPIHDAMLDDVKTRTSGRLSLLPPDISDEQESEEDEEDDDEDLRGLAEYAVATMHKVDTKVLAIAEGEAKKRGFKTATLMPQLGLKEGYGYLVIGRDEQAVQSVSGEVKRNPREGIRKYLAASALPAAFLTGAAAVWTGLAYS